MYSNRKEKAPVQKYSVSKNDGASVSVSQFRDNRQQTEQIKQLQSLASAYTEQKRLSIQKRENQTGLPDKLKSGIENLSGYSMDDVKVHYNSNKPSQLQAHAYAQGTNIHIAPGQEKHLPHEAWHVVQQKQGRVTPTVQMKGKVKINDDVSLEKEADAMGAKALRVDMKDNPTPTQSGKGSLATNSVVQNMSHVKPTFTASNLVIQRLIVNTGEKDILGDAKGDAGWITSSSLQVALDHGGAGQHIITDVKELETYIGLKTDENIYFVGHGWPYLIGLEAPKVLARRTGLALPPDYRGKIISLNCSSGTGVETSPIHSFTGSLKSLGVDVEGPRGPSLHHPDIPGKVRVIIPDYWESKVKPWIQENRKSTEDKWKEERTKIIESGEYIGASPSDKLKILAKASVALSKAFYLELVEWADKEGYLYGTHESHTRSTLVLNK